MKTSVSRHAYKRRILVTGGAGFIGSAVAAKLAEDDNNLVVIIDNLITGNAKKVPNGKENIRFIKGDVNEYKEIMELMLSFQFHYVFHYAALVGVERTQKYPVSVLKDIKGIENILKLSKNTGVKRIFYASSSEVYGEPVEIPQNEHTTPLNSRLPYAIVKNLGEAYLKSYNMEYGLDYTIFRFFNTYGPKQSGDFVMSKFIKAALKNEDINIYGDGKQTRTFCYIDDNIEACTKIAYNDLYINDVVNIGSSQEIAINDLAKAIVRLTGSSSKIIHLPALPDGDMKRRCPDIFHMKKVLGKNLIPIETGIKNILKEGLFE